MRRLITAGILVASLGLASTAQADEWAAKSELSNATSRDATELVIDANGLGDFVAAWTQATDGDIAAAFMPMGGAPGAPQEFAGDYADPDVAIGPSSTRILAWESGSTDTTVYASSTTGAPGAFSLPAMFVGDGHTAPAAPASAQDPSVAVNGFGTGMLFFERDYYNPPSYTDIAEAIEGRILTNPASNTWNAGADVHGAIKDPRISEISVATDGSAFLGTNNFSQGPCWDIGVTVMENDGTGSSGGDPAVDCSGKYNGIYPSSARLPSGDILMTYRHHNDGGVYALDISKARAKAGSTNLEDDEVRLDNVAGGQTTNGKALVRTDAAGNAVVVWQDTDDSSGGVKSMLARFRPAGQTAWGPVELISSGEAYSGASDLDFDMDAAGNGYLVYKRTNSGSGDEEIVAAERAPGAGGGWTTPELLSEGQGTVEMPQVAAARNGEAFASWTADGNDGVFYSRNAPPACSDGIDNDTDGKTDFPADPGCTGPNDNDETDPVTPPPADTTAPELKLKGKKKQSNKKKVIVKASCDEDCTVVVKPKGKATVKSRAPASAAKKSKTKLKLKTARANLSAGQTKKLKLKFKGNKTKKLVKKALKKKKGKIKLKLQGKATDAAGNKAKTTFKVTLKK